jgi:hypothetical protein
LIYSIYLIQMQKEFMQEAIDLSKENIEKQFG